MKYLRYQVLDEFMANSKEFPSRTNVLFVFIGTTFRTLEHSNTYKEAQNLRIVRHLFLIKSVENNSSKQVILQHYLVTHF
jgi:hypothetical protein